MRNAQDGKRMQQRHCILKASACECMLKGKQVHTRGKAGLCILKGRPRSLTGVTAQSCASVLRFRAPSCASFLRFKPRCPPNPEQRLATACTCRDPCRLP